VGSLYVYHDLFARRAVKRGADGDVEGADEDEEEINAPVYYEDPYD